MKMLVLGWRQHCISARLEDRRFQCTCYLEFLDYTTCVKLHQYVTQTSKARVTTNGLQSMDFELTRPSPLRSHSILNLNRLLEYT
jgi:hypothetical protein